MSTATVIIILFIITLAAIGLIFYSQARERAKIMRARRLAAAEDAFQHSCRLLDELPPQYLSQPIRNIIVNRLEELALSLKSFNSRIEYDSRLADARLRLTQADRQPDAPIRIETAETVRDVKMLLQQLFKLVEGQHKARKLKTGQAQDLLRQVLFLGLCTQADLYISQGREAADRGNLRKAIHHYRLAATELSQCKDQPAAQAMINACKARIQELEHEASVKEPGAQPQAQQRSRLDEQLEDFIHDGEAWKKRADFES